MNQETIRTVAEVILAVGTILGGLLWLSRMHLIAGKSLAQLTNLNDNLGQLTKSNSEEHGKIWTRLDQHGVTLGEHGEQIARYGPRGRGVAHEH